MFSLLFLTYICGGNHKNLRKLPSMDLDASNPGSSVNQIVIFTKRIKKATEHLKKNKKDFSMKRGLLNLVSKRSRMLKYLLRTDPVTYDKVRKELSIRK